VLAGYLKNSGVLTAFTCKDTGSNYTHITEYLKHNLPSSAIPIVILPIES
jgi:hypothetical protein